jgi:regulator of replication initiation timing
MKLKLDTNTGKATEPENSLKVEQLEAQIRQLETQIRGFAQIKKERDALKLENANLVAENAELKRKLKKGYITETDLRG